MTLETRIAEYLASRMPDAAQVRVDNLVRIYGGSSQETYRFRACWQSCGRLEQRRLILRRAAVEHVGQHHQRRRRQHDAAH